MVALHLDLENKVLNNVWGAVLYTFMWIHRIGGSKDINSCLCKSKNYKNCIFTTKSKWITKSVYLVHKLYIVFCN